MPHEPGERRTPHEIGVGLNWPDSDSDKDPGLGDSEEEEERPPDSSDYSSDSGEEDGADRQLLWEIYGDKPPIVWSGEESESSSEESSDEERDEQLRRIIPPEPEPEPEPRPRPSVLGKRKRQPPRTAEQMTADAMDRYKKRTLEELLKALNRSKTATPGLVQRVKAAAEGELPYYTALRKAAFMRRFTAQIARREVRKKKTALKNAAIKKIAKDRALGKALARGLDRLEKLQAAKHAKELKELETPEKKKAKKREERDRDRIIARKIVEEQRRDAERLMKPDLSLYALPHKFNDEEEDPEYTGYEEAMLFGAAECKACGSRVNYGEAACENPLCHYGDEPSAAVAAATRAAADTHAADTAQIDGTLMTKAPYTSQDGETLWFKPNPVVERSPTATNLDRRFREIEMLRTALAPQNNHLRDQLTSARNAYADQISVVIAPPPLSPAQPGADLFEIAERAIANALPAMFPLHGPAQARTVCHAAVASTINDWLTMAATPEDIAAAAPAAAARVWILSRQIADMTDIVHTNFIPLPEDPDTVKRMRKARYLAYHRHDAISSQADIAWWKRTGDPTSISFEHATNLSQRALRAIRSKQQPKTIPIIESCNGIPIPFIPNIDKGHYIVVLTDRCSICNQQWSTDATKNPCPTPLPESLVKKGDPGNKTPVFRKRPYKERDSTSDVEYTSTYRASTADVKWGCLECIHADNAARLSIKNSSNRKGTRRANKYRADSSEDEEELTPPPPPDAEPMDETPHLTKTTTWTGLYYVTPIPHPPIPSSALPRPVPPPPVPLPPSPRRS